MTRELPTKIEHEQELMELMFSDDIKLSFTNFVLRLFPWSEANTSLANFSRPRRWQLDFMEAVDTDCLFNVDNPDPKIFKGAVSAGRGIGKTTLNAWMMLWLISTRPGMSIICLANSETQLKSTLWAEVSKWLSMLPNKHWFEMQSLSLHPAVWYAEALEKNFGIDSKHYTITCRTYSEERPDTFVGHHNTYGMAIFNDEASGTPDVINTSILGFFTENNANRFWVMTSNPRRLNGWFYDIFNAPLDDWQRFQIDTRTVEGIDPSFHEGIISRYGLDSDVTRVEVLGQFPQQDINSFIPFYRIEEALNREPIKDPYAPLIMGCDIAGEGGDNTVVVLRRGTNIEHIFDWSGLAVNASSRKIEELINKYKPDAVVVDANGIGVQTYYYLADEGYSVHAEKGQNRADDHESYRNRRTELHVKMAEWLELASIPNHSGLIQNLKSLESFIEPNTGKLALASKRVKGAVSTDYSDALAYTFAVSPARSDMNFGRCRSYQYEADELLVDRRFSYA
ncbi:terminase [Candidatus Liberibacter solanacearum]|uniref:terminase large subunit domain-containing protein n=1 Tax=Candidatus Liberibacter solanacearum TaxID=556287 RepID=UPI0006DBEC74|nr:terminase family protein [Candidatus Liberibacter solanacearum]KQC48736.1 terminase [Candidatus Liberibacter solanacearum]